MLKSILGFTFILLTGQLTGSEIRFLYFVEGIPGVETVWFINNQPVVRGNSGYSQEISRFVIPGANSGYVHYPRGVGLPIKKNLKITKARSLQSDGETVVSVEPNSANHELQTDEFTFDANIPESVAWIWQVSDSIDAFSNSDKAEVRDFVAEYLNEFLNENPDMAKFHILTWSAKIRKPSQDKLKQLKLAIQRLHANESSLKVIDREKIEVINGTKVLLVYSADGPLLKQSSMGEFGITIPTLYLVKVSGKWAILEN